MFEGLVQPMHLLVILVIALLVFGPGKLKDLGKGLGEGIRGFKDAIKDEPNKVVTTEKAVTAENAASKDQDSTVQN
jgi:sec-independent protein translocase protein TatA